MINWKLVWTFYATLVIPFLYLINILIAFKNPGTFNASFSLVVIGVIISIVGITMWIITYINLGNSFGVLPKKQKKVKRGLYRYLNHPMYIAIFLCFLGISLANRSWQGLVFLNLVIAPLLFIRAILEEKKLS